ncbi:MAG: hypothetical protein AB1758_14485 [Candidatus Eremiobacterota bacterium]
MRPEVRYDPAREWFVYSYTLTNQAGAEQDIVAFTLSCRVPIVTAVTAPQNWWGSVGGSTVGTVVDYGVRRTRAHRIRAGSTLGSFSFASPSLPSVVPAYVRGNAPIPSEPVGVRYVHISIPFPEDCYQLQTLGPLPDVDPPQPQQPVDLCALMDQLSQSVRRARELGWIRHESLAKHFQHELEHARDKCKRGQLRPADNKLREILHKLEKERGKKLDDNAYFLLRPNLEFLRHRLERLIPREHDDNDDDGDHGPGDDD